MCKLSNTYNTFKVLIKGTKNIKTISDAMFSSL